MTKLLRNNLFLYLPILVVGIFFVYAFNESFYPIYTVTTVLTDSESLHRIDVNMLNSQQKNTSGALDISLYEFEDSSNIVWVELKVELNLSWARVNGLNNDEYYAKFLKYMVDVIKVSNMIELKNEANLDIPTVYGRVKLAQSNKLVQDNLISTKFSFFNINREYKFQNPFDEFWNTVSGIQHNDSSDWKRNILNHWGDIFLKGNNFANLGQQLPSISQELNIELCDIQQSSANYYFSSNRNIYDKHHNTIILLKKKFVYWQNCVSGAEQVVLQVNSPNTVVYYCIVLLAGLLSVGVMLIISKKKIVTKDSANE
ncbi:MAG: hypothetical protein FWF56_06705 [Firmicutes bacterium]|nr:hypothetical protein [Bacillota bacterium]MCL1953573.1 hypothetical protein [Bacillota bacterium]